MLEGPFPLESAEVVDVAVALKTALGLQNVSNTSDANKPVSSATQTALDAKQATSGITLTQNTGYATLTINGVTVNFPTVTPA